MAILKAINVKHSDRKRFLAALDYVANSAKNPYTKLPDKAEKFEMVTLVNRKLYGKENCKRQFKQYIVSMNNEWPDDKYGREKFNKALENVLNECETYFMNQGYRASGYIHCNTKHPHFHMLLETCNAVTGKQFAESKSNLSAFKEFISSKLCDCGLDEKILMEVRNITEEELFEEEQSDLNNDTGHYNDEYYEYQSKSKENFIREIQTWNIGTMEHFQINIPQRTMCVVVAPEQKREMCKIVSHNEKRILCNIVSHE